MAILRRSSLSGQELTDAATTTEAVVDRGQEAVHHGLADRVSLAVEQAGVHLVVVEGVEEEDERDCRVDVDDDEAEHGRHEQLITVQRYTLDDALQLGEAIDHVQEMERVEDWRLEQALQREGQVNEDEHEATILHEETQADPLLLEVHSDVAEVRAAILDEGVVIWALSQ